MTEAGDRRRHRTPADGARGPPGGGAGDGEPLVPVGPVCLRAAWGSVREDYSADGDAWASFPHDHARSRAYRWNEDGMAGLSDLFGRLNLGLALWNGEDPILKERMFGLTNSQGNHGEDVKEYWWYLDAVPSSAWLRWRYHYPQAAFPYERLIDENARRSKLEPEFELLDTGIFDDNRYWIVEVQYAKADPTDILARITVRNAGPEAATIHVLPTIWFRNEWSYDPAGPRPTLEAGADGSRIRASHPQLGDYELHVGAGPDGAPPELLFCENETNAPRIFGSPATTPWPEGRHQRPRRRRGGDGQPRRGRAPRPRPGTGWTSGRARPRRSASGCARRRPALAPAEAVDPPGLLGAGFEATMAARLAEADEFYADLRRPGATDDEAMIMRQAFAGMLWSKQYYAYDVTRWLEGDPGRADAAERAADRAQRRLAPLRRRGHPVDARPVGVPVVRGLGPRVPRDHARPRRPGVREVPAAGHVPGVVPAPERRAAGLRVVVRRRQPAGPRAGRDRGVGDRRPPGHGVPRSGSSTS